MLDVCLLGTGGMMPLPRRWLTALMCRYNGKNILIEWLGLRLGRGGRKGQFRPNYQRLAPTADACVRKEETG